MKGKLTKIVIAMGLSIATLSYPLASVVAAPGDNLYRVRESWGNVASQIGAFKNLNSAIAMAKSNQGYEVYDSYGKVVFQENSASEYTVTKPAVKVTAPAVKTPVVNTPVVNKPVVNNTLADKTPSANTVVEKSEEGTIVITKAVKKFITAGNANANINSVGDYAPGKYYIYKTYNGMLNISKTRNTPGAWVNVKGVTEKPETTKPAVTQPVVTKPVTQPEVTKPAATKPAATQPVTTTPAGNKVEGDTVTLAGSTSRFMDADSAKSNVASIGTYPAGKYYIYKTYNGMYNITRIPRVPGSWVNLGLAAPETKAPDSVLGEGTTEKEETTKPTTPVTETEKPAENNLNQAEIGAKVVETAKKALGTPYVWGGESYAEGGFDCSGLVYYAYQQAGVKVPRTASTQYAGMTKVGTPLPGDVVIYSQNGRITHSAIYVGDNKIIHAPQPGEVVKYANLTNTWSKIVGYVRGIKK